MIHEPAIERIKGGVFSGEHFYNLLEGMCQEAEKVGQGSYHLAVSYVDEGDEFVEGTYVPEIHLIVRKVDDSDDQTEV